MKIIKKKYNNVDSKKINQYPWGFNKMLKFKRRKWLSKKYNDIFSTTGNLQAVRKKFLITYKLKTKLLFKKYFASKMTERQFKKLFRSNARYKATFYNIIKTEHRLDSIIFRLFLFSSIFQARNLIKNNFFIVNNLIQNNPTFILNPGDIIKPSNFYSFNLCYNNILNTISSTYKYLNRIFNKYSYPFIIKKISTRFKEGFPKLGKPLRTIVKRIVKNVKWETTRRYKLKYKPQRFLTTYLGLYLTNNKQKHIKQSSKKFKNLVHWQKKTSQHTRSRYVFLKTKQLFKRRVYNLPLFNYRILQLPVKRHLRRFTKKRLLNRWFSLKNIQQPAFYNFKITSVLNKTVSDELRDFRNKKLQNKLKHRSKKTIIKERKNLFKKKKLLRSNKIMFKKEKLKKLKIKKGYLLRLKKKKKFLNLKKKKIVYYSVTKSLKSNILFFSELNFVPKSKKLNFNKKKTFKIFKTSKLSADTQKKIISSKIVKQLNYIYCINKKIKFASEIGKYLFNKKKVKRDFTNTKEKNMLESLELWESKNFSKRIRLMPVKEMFFRKLEMRKLRKRRKIKFRISKNRHKGKRFKFKKFSSNPLRNVERKPKRLKLYYQLNNTMNLLNFINKKKVIKKIKKKKKILKKKKNYV